MMMTTSKLYARAGATAIAAILALSSTQLVAQEVPATTEPPPTAAPVLVPAPEVTPTASDPARLASEATPPDPVAKPATAKRTTTVHTSKVAATHVAARPAPKRAAAPVASAKAAPPAVGATQPAVPTARQSAVAPIVNVMDKPANGAVTPKASPTANGNSNETMMEIGGGALALLVLGGGAYALTRRKRREETMAEEVYEPEAGTAPESSAIPRQEPVVHEAQPALIAPSAFAWGNAQPSRESASEDGSDRRPGETWVERAYRGPSPANPSVSLRARLKRAAFFDKREREVAAGTAEPVETDAGLPDAMVEEQETDGALEAA